MYNSSTHYPSSGYQSAYPQYQQSYGTSYGYQSYGNQYANQGQQPGPPGENFSSENWNSATGYGLTQKDAVAQEMQQQKAQLTQQREDYVKKVSVLRHELEQLRMQKQELVGEGSSDRDLANILRENDKLQEEIQGKMKAIHNVIEMLSSIIKDGRTISDLEASLCIVEEISKSPPPSHYSSHYVDNHNQIQNRSQTPELKRSPEKYCYVHYDTGLHWCRMCDEFPETAKDFLLHLQNKKHREMVKENDVDNTPWHKLPAEPVLPTDENATKKRVPIKGLQFFISAPSWYCKLCDLWIGDLHCASHHLKSQTHFQNYENFVVQNPHWEMEWLKDREIAMSRNAVQDSSDSDTGKKKKKRNKDKRQSSDLFPTKDKKKKKRSKKRRKQSSDSSSSSSSSSDSSSDEEKADRSRSIRVAMRNMKQVQSIMDEDLTSKWNVLERLVEEHKKKEDKREKVKEPEPDPLINQWMTVSQPQEKDKRLLDDLKDRMKQKQEVEKTKQIEMDRRRREKEKEERELQERKEREAREEAEEAERERKRKEQEEFERIRDKERNQVRFKTNNYRRRRTPSRSDEEAESPREKQHHRHERYRSNSRSERSPDIPRSRSRSQDRNKTNDGATKKKPPGPPSYKKLPFIGRMPLFKNKKADEKEEKREIKKESYEPVRRTRFQPGNLARAFIPKPDVVCFPKLSSIPPLSIPPPPVVMQSTIPAPDPPIIGKESPPKPPPPPKIAKKEEPIKTLSEDEMLYADTGNEVNSSMMSQYYQYNNMMYSHNYEYPQSEAYTPSVCQTHAMPLQPPPLPPDDDLALLGICADDMAAQSF